MTQTEALRLALEALTVLLDEWTPARQAQLKGMEAVTAIKAALEANDEPVAWVRWDEEENYYDVRRTPPPQEAIEYLAKWNRPAWVPAYPTPPQRKPLTDEQILAIDCMTDKTWAKLFARAIEAAHGIKDNT